MTKQTLKEKIKKEFTSRFYFPAVNRPETAADSYPTQSSLLFFIDSVIDRCFKEQKKQLENLRMKKVKATTTMIFDVSRASVYNTAVDQINARIDTLLNEI